MGRGLHWGDGLGKDVVSQIAGGCGGGERGFFIRFIWGGGAGLFWDCEFVQK